MSCGGVYESEAPDRSIWAGSKKFSKMSSAVDQLRAWIPGRQPARSREETQREPGTERHNQSQRDTNKHREPENDTARHVEPESDTARHVEPEGDSQKVTQPITERQTSTESQRIT